LEGEGEGGTRCRYRQVLTRSPVVVENQTGSFETNDGAANGERSAAARSTTRAAAGAAPGAAATAAPGAALDAAAAANY